MRRSRECPLQALGAEADLGSIPQITVLVGQEHELALGVDARLASGVVQQHEGQEPVDLGLVRHEAAQHPGQADGLGAQVSPDELVAGRGPVPLVEDEVQDVEHRIQALGSLGFLRHREGDAGGEDLPLGPHQPLGHGRLGHEEGAGDLTRRQPSRRAQGERHLRVRRERGMAAGEDQAELVVRDGVHVERFHDLGRVGGGLGRHDLATGGGLLLRAPPGLPPSAVECSAAGDGEEPGDRVVRLAIARPSLEGDDDGLLQRVLRGIEVAQHPDERPEDLPGVRAVQALEPFVRQRALTQGRQPCPCPAP